MKGSTDRLSKTVKQKVIVTLFSKLLEIRKTILNEQQFTNPSILDEMLKNRYDLQKCIVSGSFGNYIIITDKYYKSTEEGIISYIPNRALTLFSIMGHKTKQ